MKNFICEQWAATGAIVIFSLTSIFHMLVLAGFIPYTIVGGGRIENESQMKWVESVAIAVNIFMLLIVLMKSDLIRWQLPPLAIRISLWVMMVVFVLNTIGNIFAKSDVEKWIFTPLTLLLAFICFRLATTKRKVRF